MPASQSLSGSGDPNGTVNGNPGDVYQDQTGKLWVNLAAPSTWALSSAVTVREKPLVNGVPTDLLVVDLSLTPNNAFSSKLFFAVECTDGADVQIREGDVNPAVALKLPATFATAQAVNASNAITGGTLATTFAWATAGSIATLSVTATSSLVPTALRIFYFVLYASHPGALTYA